MSGRPRHHEMTYGVLMDVHVDSVKARVCTLSERVPLVNADEALKDGDVGAISFSVAGNVTDHVVGFNVAIETRVSC